MKTLELLDVQIWCFCQVEWTYLPACYCPDTCQEILSLSPSKKNHQKSGTKTKTKEILERFLPPTVKMLNECRPGAARIFEDRGRSKCPWETIIQKRVVFVSFSCRNPINLTIPNSPNLCGWRFEVSTFVASFTWELLCSGRDFQIHLDLHSLWFTYIY